MQSNELSADQKLRLELLQLAVHLAPLEPYAAADRMLRYVKSGEHPAPRQRDGGTPPPTPPPTVKR